MRRNLKLNESTKASIMIFRKILAVMYVSHEKINEKFREQSEFVY